MGFVSSMKGHVYFVLVALLFPGGASAADRARSIPTGAACFVFVDPQGNADRPITVYTYRPQRYRANDPILFVMHGFLRNGREYRDQWIAQAERFGVLLIVPEFSLKHYPNGGMYNRGNMFDDQGKPVDRSKWTFSAVEHLFDRVKEMIGGANPTYYLYGHSAGSQFVHRLLIFRPDARIEKAVAANAGWYTMPIDRAFPYGLKQSGLSPDELRRVSWSTSSNPFGGRRHSRGRREFVEDARSDGPRPTPFRTRSGVLPRGGESGRQARGAAALGIEDRPGSRAR